MTENKQVYKCDVCGNIVEVLHSGAGALVCCGQEMKCMTENTIDAATEKHVPVVEKTESGIRVRVGSVAHPMEDAHYIEWIEVLVDGSIFRKHLNPGEKPEAEFPVTGENIMVREYCNLHGLWIGE